MRTNNSRSRIVEFYDYFLIVLIPFLKSFQNESFKQTYRNSTNSWHTTYCVMVNQRKTYFFHKYVTSFFVVKICKIRCSIFCFVSLYVKQRANESGEELGTDSQHLMWVAGRLTSSLTVTPNTCFRVHGLDFSYRILCHWLLHFSFTGLNFFDKFSWRLGQAFDAAVEAIKKELNYKTVVRNKILALIEAIDKIKYFSILCGTFQFTDRGLSQYFIHHKEAGQPNPGHCSHLRKYSVSNLVFPPTISFFQ